jgi:hypothetical protein
MFKTSTDSVDIFRCVYHFSSHIIFFVKGPAAHATDPPQPWGLLCNPVMKTINFFISPCNGAPVEWKWQGKTEVLRGNIRPSTTTSPTWTEPESNSGLRGERPATNRLSHGTTFPRLTSSMISFHVLMTWAGGRGLLWVFGNTKEETGERQCNGCLCKNL